MIDWGNLAANASWIVGCAIALASLSYASWQASIRKEKLRIQLAQPGVQRSINLAGVLFSIGLAVTSDWILETVIWSILGIMFVTLFVRSIRQDHIADHTPTEHSNNNT